MKTIHLAVLLLAPALAAPAGAQSLEAVSWDGGKAGAPAAYYLKPRTFTSQVYRTKAEARKALKLKLLELRLGGSRVVKDEVLRNPAGAGFIFRIVYYPPDF
ncbi:MAG: hypothetical protein HY077_07485 [Elusimicrobia bacterium]|nr:hypothetical protein [Elusimicrobiota bacterium]